VHKQSECFHLQEVFNTASALFFISSPMSPSSRSVQHGINTIFRHK
jgi:hypothetical protein